MAVHEKRVYDRSERRLQRVLHGTWTPPPSDSVVTQVTGAKAALQVLLAEERERLLETSRTTTSAWRWD